MVNGPQWLMLLDGYYGYSFFNGYNGYPLVN